jgi:protease YdgD
VRLGALARTVARLAAAALVTSAPADERQASGHRQSVGTLDYPWSSVAKLYNSIGGACTAVVIDRMQVLTAAHCLYGRRTGRFLPPGSVHLLLGYERGDYRVHARAARYRTGAGYDPRKPETFAADWAVLTLSEPLPAEIRPLRLGLGLPAAGTRIRTAGFPQDRAYMITADTDCRILGAMRGLLVHDCRANRGDSGAPLLSGEADRPVEILGLSVAGARRGGVPVTIAVPAARIARELAQAP